MTCPHCNHSFPLTCPRYLRAPFGKHKCPSCSAISKLRLTGRYVTVVLLAGWQSTASSLHLFYSHFPIAGSLLLLGHMPLEDSFWAAVWACHSTDSLMSGSGTWNRF